MVIEKLIALASAGVLVALLAACSSRGEEVRENVTVLNPESAYVIFRTRVESDDDRDVGGKPPRIRWVPYEDSEGDSFTAYWETQKFAIYEIVPGDYYLFHAEWADPSMPSTITTMNYFTMTPMTISGVNVVQLTLDNHNLIFSAVAGEVTYIGDITYHFNSGRETYRVTVEENPREVAAFLAAEHPQLQTQPLTRLAHYVR